MDRDIPIGYHLISSDSPMTLKHFTLSTRSGLVSFSTELEWDQAISIVSKLNNDFARSLSAQWETGNRPLSETQIAWVYRLAQDSLSPSSKAPGAQVTTILESMKKALGSGLKRPKVRLIGPNGVKVRVSIMTAGKNAGGCWINVSEGSEEVLGGKISPDGSLSVYDNNVCGKKDLESFIMAANANFDTAVKDYGFITCSCAICGLPLTNAESIQRGIGPICAEKFGVA